jgi:hypothetical protein
MATSTRLFDKEQTTDPVRPLSANERWVCEPPAPGAENVIHTKETKMITINNMLARLNGRSRRFVLSLAACSVFGVLVYASIPDASGVIHGCYKLSSGTLRVIDDATQQCDSNEAPIQWNQTGPQGAPAPPRIITVGTADNTFALMGCGQDIRSVPFVKQHNDTSLRITYHDDGFVEQFTPGGSREFTIGVRIDGSAIAPTPIYSSVQGDLDNAAVSGSITAFGYANGISAGSHTLTTRYTVGGDSCYRGNAYTVEIEEIELAH